MFQSTRTRVIAAATSVALLGATGFMVLSPAAQAATCIPGAAQVQCVGSIATGTVPTGVFAGGKKQPAGDWTTDALTDAVGVSDASQTWSMFIQLDDVIPAVPAGPIPILMPGSPAACKAASLAVGFSGTPTVTNLTVGNTAAFAARLTSSATCTGKGISDVL
jgi:hypothetical protein